jgi:hypothetical protein
MKKLIVAVVGLAVLAPGAFAASSSHFLKVSPSKAAQGQTVKISGSVDHGCQIGHSGDVATIFSRAFKGATKHKFAGIPSVNASLAKSKDGTFSIKITLSNNVKPARYSVSGRCGGGNFGSTKLKVTSGLPQGY